MVVILPVSTIFRFNFRTVLTSQRIIFGGLQFINFKQKSINQFIWRNIYSSKTVLQIVLHDPEEEPDVINKGFILSPGFSTYVSMKMTQVSLNKGFILSLGFSNYVSMKMTKVSLNKDCISSPGFYTLMNFFSGVFQLKPIISKLF
jgi:hypothetical protein